MSSPANPELTFLEDHPFVRLTVLDKIHGCLTGSALGDTIGLYTEHLSRAECSKNYPDRGFTLTEFPTERNSTRNLDVFETRCWTDDTDHALLLVLSYLHGHTSPENFDLPGEFAHRLQLWRTQGLRVLNRPPLGIGALTRKLLADKQYKSDPVSTATREWVDSKYQNAPNGSLMRTHPLGVIGVGMTEAEAWRLSADLSRTTHVDPRCVVSCCVSVGVIRGLLRGEIFTEADLDAAIDRAYNWVLSQPDLMNPNNDKLTAAEIAAFLDRKEFDQHVNAVNLRVLQLDAKKTIGYVYKCLGSAILLLRLAMRRTTGSAARVFRRKEVFEMLITDLVMEGGDADTNAAAAGALLGAFLGYGHLPNHWAMGLRHKEWFVGKIERLCVAAGIVDGSLQAMADEGVDGGRPPKDWEDGKDDDHDDGNDGGKGDGKGGKKFDKGKQPAGRQKKQLPTNGEASGSRKRKAAVRPEDLVPEKRSRRSPAGKVTKKTTKIVEVVIPTKKADEVSADEESVYEELMDEVPVEKVPKRKTSVKAKAKAGSASKSGKVYLA